jgi:hypothetical protein
LTASPRRWSSLPGSAGAQRSGASGFAISDLVMLAPTSYPVSSSSYNESRWTARLGGELTSFAVSSGGRVDVTTHFGGGHALQWGHRRL